MTCELEAYLGRLVDQDPLTHGSVYSQWSCHELATVLAQQTGVELGRETIRLALKKRAGLLSSSGVLLSVMGAVQYGTSCVFYQLVPHFDAQEFRQYIHQIMQVLGSSGKEVVMVTDRSGTHRSHQLDATLKPYQDKFRLKFLPAHSGHHLNPMEGFWRARKRPLARDDV